MAKRLLLSLFISLLALSSCQKDSNFLEAPIEHRQVVEQPTPRRDEQLLERAKMSYASESIAVGESLRSLRAEDQILNAEDIIVLWGESLQGNIGGRLKFALAPIEGKNMTLPFSGTIDPSELGDYVSRANMLFLAYIEEEGQDPVTYIYSYQPTKDWLDSHSELRFRENEYLPEDFDGTLEVYELDFSPLYRQTYVKGELFRSYEPSEEEGLRPLACTLVITGVSYERIGTSSHYELIDGKRTMVFTLIHGWKEEWGYDCHLFPQVSWIAGVSAGVGGGGGIGGGGKVPPVPPKKQTPNKSKGHMPEGKSIVKYPMIQKHINKMWEKTKEDLKAKPGYRRERGFAVYYNPKTEYIYKGKEIVGKWVENKGGTKASLPITDIRPEAHGVPPGCVYIGVVHTHTPHLPGFTRTVGLSAADSAFADANGGFVIARDYVGYIPTNGPNDYNAIISVESKIDDPTQDYVYQGKRK